MFSSASELNNYLSQLNKEYCLVISEEDSKDEAMKKLKKDKRQLKLIKFLIAPESITKSESPYLMKE